MHARGFLEDAGDGHRRLILAAHLGAAQRRLTLAHELVHDEWGGGSGQYILAAMPAGWERVVTRAETAVDAEVHHRLEAA